MRKRDDLRYILEMMSKIDTTYPVPEDNEEEPMDNSSMDGQGVDGGEELPSQADIEEPSSEDELPQNNNVAGSENPADAQQAKLPMGDWHNVQRKAKGVTTPQFDDEEIGTQHKVSDEIEKLNEQYSDSPESLKLSIGYAYSFYGKNGSHIVKDDSGNVVGFEPGIEMVEYNGTTSASFGDVAESIINMLYLMRKTSDTDRMTNSTRFEMIERYTPDFKWLRSYLYAYSGILIGDGRNRKYSIISRDLVFKLLGDNVAPVMLNEEGEREKKDKHAGDRERVYSFKFNPEWDYPSRSSMNGLEFSNVVEQLTEKFNDGENKRGIGEILSNFGEYNDEKYTQGDYKGEYKPGLERLTYQDTNTTFSKYDRIVLAFNILNTSKSDYFNDVKYTVRGDDEYSELIKRLYTSSSIYHQLLENGVKSISIQDIFSGKVTINAGNVLSEIWNGLDNVEQDKSNVIRQHISAFVKAGPSASPEEINEKIQGFQLKTIKKDGSSDETTLFDFLSELLNGDLSMSKFQYYIRAAIAKKLCGDGQWELMDELGRNFTTPGSKSEEDLTAFLKEGIGNQKSIDMTLKNGRTIVFIECQGDDHYVPRYTNGVTMDKLGDDYDKHLAIINSYLKKYSAAFDLNSISELKMAVAENVVNLTSPENIGLKNPLNLDTILAEIKLLLRQASDKQKYIALNGKEINVDGVDCNTSYIYVKPDRYKKLNGSVGAQWPNGDIIWKAASIPFITNFDLAKQGRAKAIEYFGQRQVSEGVEETNDVSLSEEIYNNTLDWSQRPENWQKGPYADELTNFIGKKSEATNGVAYLKETIKRTLFETKNRLL